MPHLLITDDDHHLRKLVRTYGEREGFCCEEAETGQQALDAIKKTSFDIIILDVMMPGTDGFQVLEEIRRVSQVPVIMLTALEDEQTQVKAFNLYADDYVIKPVSPIILLKRMETILRRTARTEEHRENGEGLVLSQEAYCAYYRGEKLPLTLSEYLLLQTLYREPKRVFTREQLILSIFNEDYIGNDRIIDAHVKNLRKKLPVPCIRTVIGVGYQFDKAAEQNAAEGH